MLKIASNPKAGARNQNHRKYKPMAEVHPKSKNRRTHPSVVSSNWGFLTTTISNLIMGIARGQDSIS